MSIISDKRRLIDKMMIVMRSVDLVPDLDLGRDEFDFQPVMEAELEWLRMNGIITGITDLDIEVISSLSKPGMAGWNSRLVYSEGRWFPYYETENPSLIRILEEMPVDTVDVPEDAASFPTASVSPRGKSITLWGKVKADL